MTNQKEDLTFDDLLNTAEESEQEHGPDVLDEINRCRGIYERRQAAKRKEALDIKPLYWEQLKKKELAAMYPVYKFWCVYPKRKPYEPCQHVGQVVVDRDILTKDEHISYLAQPKRNLQRPMRPPRCVHEKKYLPNCTTRINSLAHPKTTQLEHNWKDFHRVLSIRQSSNLRKTLQRPPVESTTIETALSFIREERRLKSALKKKALRRCDQLKRKVLRTEKKQISKIIFALYGVMKEFLTSDQFALDSSDLSCLCKVIEDKLIQFCGLDKASTSHVQHLFKTVAQNLAIWIEKFTSNCGFRTPHTDRQSDRTKDIGKPLDEQELLLPVEDYIPYQSPTISEAQESIYGGEKDLGDENYEN